MFQRSAVEVTDIYDGSSQTFVIGEVVGLGRGTNSGMAWCGWNIFNTRNGINFPLKLSPPGRSWDLDNGGYASTTLAVASSSSPMVASTSCQRPLANSFSQR